MTPRSSPDTIYRIRLLSSPVSADGSPALRPGGEGWELEPASCSQPPVRPAQSCDVTSSACYFIAVGIACASFTDGAGTSARCPTLAAAPKGRSR